MPLKITKVTRYPSNIEYWGEAISRGSGELESFFGTISTDGDTLWANYDEAYYAEFTPAEWADFDATLAAEASEIAEEFDVSTEEALECLEEALSTYLSYAICSGEYTRDSWIAETLPEGSTVYIHGALDLEDAKTVLCCVLRSESIPAGYAVDLHEEEISIQPIDAPPNILCEPIAGGYALTAKGNDLIAKKI